VFDHSPPSGVKHIAPKLPSSPLIGKRHKAWKQSGIKLEDNRVERAAGQLAQFAFADSPSFRSPSDNA